MCSVCVRALVGGALVRVHVASPRGGGEERARGCFSTAALSERCGGCTRGPVCVRLECVHGCNGWRAVAIRCIANGSLCLRACLRAGGGRNHVTARYLRHFNLISIVDFDNATLTRIFSTVLAWHLDAKAFPAGIKVRGARRRVHGSTHTAARGGAGGLLAAGLARLVRVPASTATPLPGSVPVCMFEGIC